MLLLSAMKELESWACSEIESFFVIGVMGIAFDLIDLDFLIGVEEEGTTIEENAKSC